MKIKNHKIKSGNKEIILELMTFDKSDMRIFKSTFNKFITFINLSYISILVYLLQFMCKDAWLYWLNLIFVFSNKIEERS